MLGNVDSGKSTLSAILTSAPGTLDNGRGEARQKVFNFTHEANNGRTSSIAHEIMGFKADGEQYVTKVTHTQKKNKIWPDIVANSDKIVHLLDMCGHEKYLKTTMHGLTSQFPDYCLIVVGANMGIQKMTKEHLGISLAMEKPLLIVFTKIDLAPEGIYKQNLDKMKAILKKVCNKVPVCITRFEDAAKIIDSISTGKVCPIFSVSSCTGEGIDTLRRYMGIMKRPQVARILDEEQKVDSNACQEITAQFVVDSCYQAKGIGLVLGGIVTKGTIKVNQVMMFGPDRQGNFKEVIVKGIHENRVGIQEAQTDSSVCFNIKTTGKHEEIKRNHIRKGSCLINPLTQTVAGVNPYHQQCIRHFDANIKILHGATTISEGYQGVVHMGGVRQTVQVIKIFNKNVLRAGDEDTIRFKFRYGVELIEKGSKLMIREGNTKCLGHITKVYPMTENPTQNKLDQSEANKENTYNGYAAGTMPYTK